MLREAQISLKRRLLNCLHEACWVLGCRSGQGQGGGEGGGKEVARWNLRKCSAAALDVVSVVFHEELLPIITPIVQERIQVCGASPRIQIQRFKC